MRKAVMNAIVICADTHTVALEFGRTQASFWLSAKGTVQRKLKLKKGDKVRVTVERL